MVRVVYLQVAGAQGRAVKRGSRVYIGIVIEAVDGFAAIHRLRPNPGTNTHGYGRLHRQVYLDTRRDAHCELAATGAINTNLLCWSNVDQRRGQDLLRGGRCYFEYNTAKGQERVLRREVHHHAGLQLVAILAYGSIERLYSPWIGVAEDLAGIGDVHVEGEGLIARVACLDGIEQ